MCNCCSICCGKNMKLDEHPKLMALICTAIGIAGIGLILTIAFNDQDTMMGVGIALGVFGVAATILGCIHLQSASALTDLKKNDDLGPEKTGTKSIAPNKIPSPFDVSKGKIRGVDDDASPSPSRIPPYVEPNQDLGIGQTRWAGVNSSVSGGPSPARGILPPGQEHQLDGFHAGGNNDRPPAIYKSTQVNDQQQQHYASSPPPVLPRGGSSNGSVGGASSSGMVLSPYEKRSFPVPSGLFPPAGTSVGAAKPGQSQSFEVDTGVGNGSGYDAKTRTEQIRQLQPTVDAVNASQRAVPVGMEDHDEDALPRGYWQEKQRQ